MASRSRVRPPLVPTALVTVAVAMLMVLSARAAWAPLTRLVEAVVVVAAIAVIYWVGRYLWYRGGSESS